MLSISNINFSNGVYSSSPAGVNGLEVSIMQSAANVDTVIKDFEKIVYAGGDPNNAIDEVLSRNHLTEKNFTDADIEKINRTVENIYRKYRGY